MPVLAWHCGGTVQRGSRRCSGCLCSRRNAMVSEFWRNATYTSVRLFAFVEEPQSFLRRTRGNSLGVREGRSRLRHSSADRQARSPAKSGVTQLPVAAISTTARSTRNGMKIVQPSVPSLASSPSIPPCATMCRIDFLAILPRRTASSSMGLL